MEPRASLHPDFGPSYGEQPVPYGIPVTIVNGGPRVRVTFEYADESDRVRYPLSRATRIEGGWNAGGDRHAIVVDARTCRLYETWNTRLQGGRWTAGRAPCGTCARTGSGPTAGRRPMPPACPSSRASCATTR